MNLVKFLLFGAILLTASGELGHFPFGASTTAVSLSDLALFLSWLFFLIWIVVTKRKVEVLPPFGWMMVFWGIGFLSLALSLAVFPYPEVFKGSLYLFRFILYSSAFLLVVALRKSSVLSLDGLIDVFIKTGIAVAILGVLQLIFLPNLNSALITLTDFGFDPHQGRLASTFLDPNFTATYLILTIALVTYHFLKYKSPKNLAALVFLFLALILTYSRSGYLMLVIFMVVLGIFYWNKISSKAKVIFFLACLLGISSAFPVFPRFGQRISGGFAVDASAAERFDSWQKGLTVFRTSPFVGVGFDNFRFAQERLNLFKLFSPDGGHAGSGTDSSLLLVLATTGVFGFAAFMLFWFSAFKILNHKKREIGVVVSSVLIALFVNSQFINSLLFPAVMLWYFSILGAVSSYED